MGAANFLLERWSAIRLLRRLRRSLVAAALALAVTGSLALAVVSPGEAGIEAGATRAYSLLVWTEFLLILVATLVESGASIAEERRNGTWDDIFLSDLSDGEIARGKLLGSLLWPALLILLCLPAHLAFAFRSQARWELVAGFQALLVGTSAAVAGFGVVASSRTARALHAVALGAAVVLFPWFAGLDWLAGRGFAPALCRLLHPVRHLEWMLADGPTAAGSSAALLGVTYLTFAVTVAAVSWLIAANSLRSTGPGYSLKLKGIARSRPARTVWDDPVLWRECHEPGGQRIMALVGLAAIVVMFASVWTVPGRESQRIAISLYLRTNALLTTLLLASGVAVGMRASVTLVDERARRTIALLFLADIEPMGLIRSKLVAIFRPLGLVISLVLIFAGVGYGEKVGYLTPVAWYGAAGAALIVLADNLLIAGLSLACSSLARSTRTALLAGVGLLIANRLGTILLGVGLSPLLPERVVRIMATASPIMQLSIVEHAVTGHPDTLGIPMLLGVLSAELAFGLAAIALAAWRLEWESRPSCP